MKRKTTRRGFTLIELAIVMGVASLLFAGLWRLMASGNTQVRDQAVAEQHRQLISAVSSFLETTEAQSILAQKAANSRWTLPFPNSNDDLDDCKTSYATIEVKRICEFLPAGFTRYTTNAYGQTFSLRILKDNQAAGEPAKTYSFMILTIGGDTIPDTSGGSISSLIGSDGGFIYSTDVCGTNYACGAFGAWALDPAAKYAFPTVSAGHIATRTLSMMNVSQSTPWLARSAFNQGPEIDIIGSDYVPAGPSDPGPDTVYDYNALQADTYLGRTGTAGSSVSTIYGAAHDNYYGGGVKRMREISSGTDSTTYGDAPPLLVTPGSCSSDDPTNPTCLEAAIFNGDVSVIGLLNANKLYADQFIYRTESDRRLKKDIKLIDDPLGKIGTLGAYSFEMKSSGEKKLGLIAQEVQKVFPEAVSKIDSEYLGIDYPMLVGPLVGAVNELRENNIALKAQIEAQEKEIKALRDLIGTEEPEDTPQEKAVEDVPVEE